MVSSTDSRAGTPDDAVDGVVPVRVVDPATGEALANVLAAAARDRQVTVLRGGGTKMDWGNPPSGIDIVVRTVRLNQLVVHRHADLTATVQAGMTLRALNGELARHGQWLPLDTAFDDATIGGLVATNDSGPLRHRYGTPRDLLIGATLALSDGRLVTSGGHVVKNVAGYDLGRLVSGSHGSFGALTEATFKLLPLPLATETLVVSGLDAEAAGESVAAISASQVDPVAVDVRATFQTRHGDDLQLLVRFASSPGAVDAQVTASEALLFGNSGTAHSRPTLVTMARRLELAREPVEVAVGADSAHPQPLLAVHRVAGSLEADLWREQVAAPWASTGAVVRLAWMPTDLPRLLALLREIALTAPGSITFAGRACVGSGHVALGGAGVAQGEVIRRLRASGIVGNVVVLRASGYVKHLVGVWGPAPEAAAPLKALKQLFDPAGILNAGRGPV